MSSKEQQKAYRDSGKRRAMMYKLDVDTMNEMLAEGCRICGSHERLCIDHDHKCCTNRTDKGTKTTTCGKCTRGILCDRCNKVLGLVRDDSLTLQRMIDYLDT
jgi:hypothetical protein